MMYFRVAGRDYSLGFSISHVTFQEVTSVWGVVALSLMVSAGCHRSYQNRIPNGHSVLNPCDGTIWPGVGHRNPGGRGTLNAFGEAFRDAGHQWTQALCMADSDGDGMTNGQELGDNDCSWTPSNGRALGSVKGHPVLRPDISTFGLTRYYHNDCCSLTQT